MRLGGGLNLRHQVEHLGFAAENGRLELDGKARARAARVANEIGVMWHLQLEIAGPVGDFLSQLQGSIQVDIHAGSKVQVPPRTAGPLRGLCVPADATEARIKDAYLAELRSEPPALQVPGELMVEIG